eukprot:1013694-Pelagomonas_calceolata.AAC.6
MMHIVASRLPYNGTYLMIDKSLYKADCLGCLHPETEKGTGMEHVLKILCRSSDFRSTSYQD